MALNYRSKLFGGGPGGGSGVGSSLTTQVLFNSSGSVAGDAGLTYDAGTDTLTVGGLKIATGAVNGKVWTSDAAGVGSWQAGPAPAAAGADTQVLFNDGGVIAGDAGFTFDITSKTLTFPTAVGAATTPQGTTRITFPLEAAAAPFSTVTQTFTNTHGTRKNQVVSFGWNADNSAVAEPFWVQSAESIFEPYAGTQLSEWHLMWSNAARTTNYRPWSFAVNRADESATGYIQMGVMGFRGLDDLVYESIDLAAGTKIHYLYHGISFLADTNNVSIFKQKNAAGNGTIDTFKINASNEMELAPAGGVVAWSGGVHGYQSTATGAYAFAPGTLSTASGASSTALGDSSLAHLQGQVTQGWGRWTAAGQSQHSLLSQTVVFWDANDAEFMIGRTYRATMRTGNAYSVKVNVVMAEYGAVGNVARFTGEFTATMSGAAATARIDGSTADFALTAGYTNIASPLTMYAKADTTNGAITLWVHPPAANSKTYIGTASLEWVEINYN